MSNDTFKNLVKEFIYLDDVYNECNECGRPTLLHREAECTRDVEEGLEVIAKNWRDLRRRLKPILKEIQEERKKENEQNIYLDGIKRIIKQIQIQMKTPSTEVKTDGVSTPSVGCKAKLLTKPAKVPTWTQDLTLETFSKQLQRLSDIL